LWSVKIPFPCLSPSSNSLPLTGSSLLAISIFGLLRDSKEVCKNHNHPMEEVLRKYKSKLKQQAWMWLTLAAFTLLVYVGFPGARSTAQNPSKSNQVLGNYDVRVNGKAAFSQLLQNRLAVARQKSVNRANALRVAIAQLNARVPGARVQISPLTTSAEIVESKNGALTAAAPGRLTQDIVRGFLRENAAVYGIEPTDVEQLRFVGESISRKSGLRMVRLEQVVNEIPVFQSELRALVDRDGRLVRTVGLLAPAAREAESFKQTISPAQALVSAMSAVGITLNSSKVTFNWLNAGNSKAEVNASDSQVAGPVSSKLVYFPLAPGILIPAWSQVAFTEGVFDWYTVVDAQTGTALWRKNIRDDASTQQARFSVYVQADGKTPADSPAPQSPNTVAPGSGTQFPEISRTIVNMSAVQDILASPDGWIADGDSTTTGNNVDAYVDRVGGAGETNVPDIGTIDNNGRPVGNPDANTLNRDFLGASPRDFSYTPAPLAGNPDAGDTPTGTGVTQVNFRRGAVTQLFYITNWYHDQLFNLGFDEAAGNFQTTNFSGMGAGNDAVRAEVQDSSGTNNANFATPPDGMLGRMQMFRFTGSNPDRDGDLDAEIVIHELTHGLSNRLIGNADGLVWSIGRGMGEGWSDFYALSLLNNTNADDPNGRYASGSYATYQLGGLTDNYIYGIRRFPYSTDNSVNPLTWADVDDTTANMSGGIAVSPLGFEFNGGLEVHNIGEVWALSLWEMRSRIIGDPAGANGDVPTGNLTALQLVTDAMKMTPSNPSFIDARDAIIAADGATNAYANEQSIWAGFADRGLGYKAVAPLGISGFGNLGHIGVGESFSLPYLDATGVTINDTTGGNGNGTVDPGETIQITVPLFNPWHHTSKNVASATATLTTSTAGLNITDNSSSYGAIPAQATTSGDTFSVQIPLMGLTCGQSLQFNVQTVSSLGTTNTTFTLRLGAPSGLGAPVTYTKVMSSGLAIPDGDPRGVTDTLTITDDLEIADIDFRVDNLQHTFTGDLSLTLKAPNGYGANLIWLREILFGGGDGDHFVNTVIDDESTNDLNQTTPAQAPYTGSWAPAFNSSVWLLFGDPAIFPDAVGQLSRMDGLSTQGSWTVHVADEFNLDNGTLNSWSIIVTPVAYTCTPFVCTLTCPANITAANDPNQCGAVVNYPDPTTAGTCTITCTPVSGSFFPVGTTTVTCQNTGGTPSCTFTITVNDTQPPSMTCPANISVANNPNQCGAVVNYPPPTITDNCPGSFTATCNPASGSFFPVGTTTVTCSVDGGGGSTCTFTVTVNDAQPPSITCPLNITAIAAPPAGGNCTAPTSTVVSYTAPTASDNCPGVTTNCVPPSGSTFPLGTTTVTCTATDASGNTATCSFTVSVFNVRLQDNSNSNTVLLFNTATGAYRFCCGGTIFTGVGAVSRKGCTYALTHNAVDRRVIGQMDFSTFRGNGSIQSPVGMTRCTISDSDVRNNSSVCQ
jgi:subtilisin-like proprotein convertase family protein